MMAIARACDARDGDWCAEWWPQAGPTMAEAEAALAPWDAKRHDDHLRLVAGAAGAWDEAQWRAGREKRARRMVWC